MALVCRRLPARQDWPTRPVTMVVPFAPGGVYDTLGRVYAAALSTDLGQQVIVENVPGAGGMTGGDAHRAAPIRTVISFCSAVNRRTPKCSFCTRSRPTMAPRDFAPVALVAEQPLILTVRSGIPAGNLHEFIAYAKANQAKMQYGSPGTGSGSHLACALFDAAVRSRSRTCPIADWRRQCRICWPAGSITCARRSPPPWRSFKATRSQAPAVLGAQAFAGVPRYSDRAGAGHQGLRCQ